MLTARAFVPTEPYAVTRDGRLTPDEARELTDKVKTDAQRLWLDLLALYNGNAHKALGFRNWSVYCEVEFELGRSAAYQLLNAGRVMDELANGPRSQSAPADAAAAQSATADSEPCSEAVARELEPARRNGHLKESWEDALDRFGPEPTAKQVRQVVRGDRAKPAGERCPTCGQAVR